MHSRPCHKLEIHSPPDIMDFKLGGSHHNQIGQLAGMLIWGSTASKCGTCTMCNTSWGVNLHEHEPNPNFTPRVFMAMTIAQSTTIADAPNTQQIHSSSQYAPHANCTLSNNPSSNQLGPTDQHHINKTHTT